MISNSSRDAKSSNLYKSVQRRCYLSTPPENAVLIETLKTIEEQIQKRNLTGEKAGQNIYSLWFLAETERNIFLWRTGHSLIDLDKFEFWVDVESLIAKRMQQVSSTKEDSQFVASLVGNPFLNNPVDREKELRYLNNFKNCLMKILSHVSALSHVTSQLSNELNLNNGSKEKVVLPSISKQ